jgi:hypothetical protein
VSTTDEQADLRRLERAAATAAPSIPDGPHVTEAVVARLRAGDEDPSLDEAYTHVSRCAACRSALASPATAAEREREAVREHQAALAEAGRGRGRVVRLWAPLAAAAAIALAVGAAVHRGSQDEPVAITQRAVAGWMGDKPGIGVAPEDANLELRVAAPRYPAAVVVTCDDRGRVLAPPAAFARDAKGELVAYLAPRTFAPHAGSAVGLVVFGEDGTVRTVAASDAAAKGAESLDAVAATLASSAGRGSLVERITLGVAK